MSSTKRILDAYPIVNAQSLGASFNSTATATKYFDRIALQIVCTGTPTGSFVIQTSVDQTTWIAIDFGTAIEPLIGADKNYFIDMVVTAIPYIRISYTSVSGAGAMTAKIFARES